MNTFSAVPFKVERLVTTAVFETHTYDNGVVAHYVNGVRHCANGPAVIHPNGYCEWHFRGKMTKVRYSDGSVHIFE